MTRLQDEIEAKGLWDLDSKVDQAMDALRCPPDDWPVDKLSGGERRRVALCKLLLRAARAAAPRRADQPSRRRDDRLARRASAQLSGRDPDRHPRSLLPRQRDGLDPRARPRPRHSLRGQLLVLARAEAEAPRAGGPRGRGAPAHHRARARMGRRPRPRPARPSRRPASSATRNSWRRPNEKGPTTAQIVIPIAERLGNNVIEFDNLKKAFGDKLLIDGLSFKLPPGGIVGVIGPNGAGKTTLFRMITGQEQPDDGSIRIGETRQARLCRPEPRLARRQQDRSTRRSPAATRSSISASARSMPAPIAAPSTSRARTSRRRSACSRAASATACTSPRS